MVIFTAVVSSLFCVSLVYCETMYVGVKSYKSYTDAKADCNRLTSITVDSQLATFGSTADYNAIKAVYNELGGSSYPAYIGLDDLRGEANWAFIDDDESYCLNTDNAGTCDQLVEWDSGEPNDSGDNEDCAEVWGSGKLNDIPCDLERYFICEITIDGDTSVEMSGSSPIVNNPIPNSPFSSPSDNIYILEFTSNKDIALLVSVLLNVVFVSCICYSMIKWNMSNKGRPDLYAKVDIDDEKL